MEKFIEYLHEAEQMVKKVDHMTYVTFPLIKDKRILLKIILETKMAITNCINSILQYEYIFRRISLYRDPKENFKTFTDRCAWRYGITREDIVKIIELFNIVEKHRQSSLEFVKNEKIVILSGNMKKETLELEKIKEFLNLAKKILKNTKDVYLR
jgi:hypothetical protein